MSKHQNTENKRLGQRCMRSFGTGRLAVPSSRYPHGCHSSALDLVTHAKPLADSPLLLPSGMRLPGEVQMDSVASGQHWLFCTGSSLGRAARASRPGIKGSPLLQSIYWSLTAWQVMWRCPPREGGGCIGKDVLSVPSKRKELALGLLTSYQDYRNQEMSPCRSGKCVRGL